MGLLDRQPPTTSRPGHHWPDPSNLQLASSHLGQEAEVGCRQSSSRRGRMQAILPSNFETVRASIIGIIKIRCFAASLGWLYN